MSASKTLVIVNEHAGGGAMADTFRRLEHRLQEAVGDFDVAFTDGPGHAIELARDGIADGYRRLVVGGGDGTLNEVVNGYLDADGAPLSPEVCLGVIAGGTGGDFRKSIGIRGKRDALRALADGSIRTLDVGRLQYRTHEGDQATRYFINICGFGLGGLVVRHISGFKHFGGLVAYFGATLRSMWGWRNPRVRLTVDDETIEQPIVTVAVGNGRYFGGGMKVTPDAELDDGLFDVTILGDLGRLEMMLLSRTIYDGSHVRHPKVSTHRARVVTADADTPVYLDVDGESLGQLPARLEVIPAVVRFIVP